MFIYQRVSPISHWKKATNKGDSDLGHSSSGPLKFHLRRPRPAEGPPDAGRSRGPKISRRTDSAVPWHSKKTLETQPVPLVENIGKTSMFALSKK